MSLPRTVAIVASASLALALAACSSHDTSPTPTTPIVTTTTPTVQLVAVSATVASLNQPGATSQAIATATLSSGATTDVTSTCVSWASDNAGVMTVSTSGVLTAHNAGSATITATCGSTSARGVLTIAFAAPGTFNLIGTLTDGTSGGALPNITLQITDGANAGLSTRTDAAGAYSMTGLAAGTFTLSASASSYVTATRTVSLVANARLDIVLQRVASSGPCTFSLNPTGQSVSAAAGVGSLTVSTGSGCAWTATSNASWLHITSGASGTGNGSVGFSVDRAVPFGRVGTLTIAGQTFTVTQRDPAPCQPTLSPTFEIVGVAGGASSFAVTADAQGGCNWFVISDAGWIHVSSGTGNNTGNGTIGINVDANPGPDARTGALTISATGGNDLLFLLNQDGPVVSPTCTFAISPTTQSVSGFGGGPSPVAVTTGSGCTWTASSNTPWLRILDISWGIGPGHIDFYSDANPTGSARSGTLTVAGVLFNVNQAP